MNNNIFQINKIFFMGVFTFAVLALPFFASAQVAPVVYTGNYSAINDYSAVKILGRADTGGDVSADVWLEWGTGTSYLNSRTSKQTITTFSNVNFYLSSINQDTKYYYRVVASNSTGTSLGEIKPLLISEDNIIEPPVTTTTQTSAPVSNYTAPTTFSIGGTSPIVITHLPENITTVSVKIKGLALPGGSIATNGWFEWGETSSLRKETIHNNIGASPSIDFSETLSGLSPNTVYYYRAVIQNQRGISKGGVFSFRTGKVFVPVVTPLVASNPVNYQKPVETEQEKKTKESKEELVEQKKDQQQLADTSSAGDFFPNTLIGWLLFIILLLVIVTLSDHLYGARKKRKEEEQKKENEATPQQ